MITKVRTRYFKQFTEQEFDLADHVILAGPNNSGKTTLLQAITIWYLALQKWREWQRHQRRFKPLPVEVQLTRKEFTALPLREMNDLWTDTLTGLRVLTIEVEGVTAQGPWRLAFEFRYQNAELVYVKPSPTHVDQLPRITEDFSVIHIPPFSGIGAEETRYDRPYQDLLIGQGKAGDILRNLLLEVYESEDKAEWKSLCARIEEIFGYQLQPPRYGGAPFIVCEYLRGIPRSADGGEFPELDIASAGSGFHQVLLLLGFFSARPSTVLLLDEPDAHLHVILQKQVYDLLRSIASRRRCQLVIATHSEVLIDGTNPSQIMSFFKHPHLLLSDTDKDQVREALKRLTALDILLAEQSSGILYVEGETDFNLLRTWARVLTHPLSVWFIRSPFWHSNQGRNPREAKGHFFALRAASHALTGILLLDGDNRRLPDREIIAEGLAVERWERYEAESYLMHPEALVRFVVSRGTPLMGEDARRFLQDQLPPAVYRDPLGHHDFWVNTPASKTLLPRLFHAVQLPVSKEEYYLIAEQMLPEEIPVEVRSKLDRMAELFGLGRHPAVESS
ncbi:MAG TPA: AAA family ATPase [Thermoanaerobaculia bacterium]|jgi:predicted ATPase